MPGTCCCSSFAQIAFRSTEYENIHRSVFGDRATMHSKVYTHRKAKGVEFLVCDALAMAAPELGLTRENLADVEQYLRLNDGIMERLLWLDPEESEQPERVRAVSKGVQGGWYGKEFWGEGVG